MSFPALYLNKTTLLTFKLWWSDDNFMAFAHRLGLTGNAWNTALAGQQLDLRTLVQSAVTFDLVA